MNRESWLTRNWRPLTMLVFVGLIVARWFGWTAPIGEAEALKLWDIIAVSLGVYTGGRSLEKLAPVVKDMLEKRNGTS